MVICNTITANRKQFARWILLMGLALVLGACSSGDNPGDPVTDPPPVGGDDPVPGDGMTDLKAIHLIGPDGMEIPITLMGGDLVVQADGTVTLAVAMRNDGFMDLVPPLLLWVGEFDPTSVGLANADTLLNESDATLPLMFGFAYSDLMGDDNMLSPGEISGAITWVFTDPDFVAFSFTGWAEGGFGPPPAWISGSVFDDLNADGVRDADEPPLSNVPIRVRFPNDFDVFLMSGPNGEFTAMTAQTGLYEVSVDFPPHMPPDSPWVTTPNPLFVTLVPGPDGRPLDFEGILFGLSGFDGMPPPMGEPVAMTPLSPGDLQMGPWSLIMGEVFNDFMFHAMVQYQGCQPGHHFILYASGDMQAGSPPRQTLTLVDEMDEGCGAAFDQDVLFDLWPLKDAYLNAFGPGDLALDLVGFDGTVLATFTVFIDDPVP